MKLTWSRNGVRGQSVTPEKNVWTDGSLWSGNRRSETNGRLTIAISDDGLRLNGGQSHTKENGNDLEGKNRLKWIKIPSRDNPKGNTYERFHFDFWLLVLEKLNCFELFFERKLLDDNSGSTRTCFYSQAN